MENVDDVLQAKVQNIDPKTREIIGEQMVTLRSNIFRPGSPKEIDSKIGQKIRKFAIWLHDMTFWQQRRFYTVHFIIKNKLLRPVFMFLLKFMNNKIDDVDIPRDWYNNHIRMFNWCMEESINDVWGIMIYQQHKIKDLAATGKINMTSEDWINHGKDKAPSYKMRQLARKIWVTEMLEDTVDREQCNFMMMRIAHEMMRHYGVNKTEMKKIPLPGQYPIYLAKGPYDPNYFLQGAGFKVWNNEVEQDAKDKEKKDKGNDKDGKSNKDKSA